MTGTLSQSVNWPLLILLWFAAVFEGERWHALESWCSRVEFVEIGDASLARFVSGTRACAAFGFRLLYPVYPEEIWEKKKKWEMNM